MASLPPRIVVASANPKKAAELAALLAALPVEVVARPADVPEVVEDGETFLDNARLKAVALASATGDAALADDSGLEVDALDGAPGVHSARFSGDDATDAENVAHLLAELARLGADDPGARRARFRCVLVLRRPDGTELTTSGTVEGHLAPSPAGDGGFGYDPVFVPDEGDGRTFAQMSATEKQAISHRGRALAELVELLER
jgi:XTP/dITP diphosphohydrolase